MPLQPIEVAYHFFAEEHGLLPPDHLLPVVRTIAEAPQLKDVIQASPRSYWMVAFRHWQQLPDRLRLDLWLQHSPHLADALHRPALRLVSSRP